MTTTAEFRFGFWIVGGCEGERRLVDPAVALQAYAACDERADLGKEAYLSAFTFGEDFNAHLQANGSTRGFNGPCWAPWLWFDIDREDDLDAAKEDARRLCGQLAECYGAEDEEVLAFFSGSKGFHVGLSTAIWNPEPSLDFNRVARHFAENLAVLAGAKIDTGVYDKVRPFRAPNSTHPKTRLHKVFLYPSELLTLKTDYILERARQPWPLTLPEVARVSQQAADDWRQAENEVRELQEAARRRRTSPEGAKLNRPTLEFIRDGATQGDRHRLLYSAAANLAEFGCPPALAHALLTESALDSGLPPGEVRRQIECGLASQKENASHE